MVFRQEDPYAPQRLESYEIKFEKMLHFSFSSLNSFNAYFSEKRKHKEAILRYTTMKTEGTIK